RQRLVDEQFRRRSLYLCLLAKGREQQGRLAEAFDKYREFATLGGGKQLVAIYDEPNGQTRPDIWARGRIDTMFRKATNPATRKPLEERVEKEWSATRNGNDLNALREFISVFGPYFDAGREAQFVLADQLLKSNNDEQLREAQTILMKLWATAEDPKLAARAMEALAGLMTRSGLLEDAVALYTQLGATYGAIPIKDGRTGGQIFNDLLTDKRLLPYLEATRIPAPARIKVDGNTSGAATTVPMGYTFEPEGELLPFYRRYRLSLTNNDNNQGAWTLRVTDKQTNEERCQFKGLRLFSPSGQPPFRLGFAKGHLLLLHLGHMAYCFDLAEKRELWQYNLLGESSKVDMTNVQYDTNNEGDTTVSFLPEGFKIRLGRSSILEPNYCCLLTRDGLTALDPYTGNKLWTRTNVLLSAHVFGDAKHVFIVEQKDGDKATSRVLNALDGTPVAGVPEFGPIFATKARVKVLGRTLLLNEGGGGKPRVIRLYDAFTGKDIWRKEYGSDSRLMDVPTAEYLAVLEAKGKFEVLQPTTGQLVFLGQLDTDILATLMENVQSPVLLHDPHRFFVVLNKTPRNSRMQYNYNYNYTAIRSMVVSGPIVAFDRASSKRLWYTGQLFENQSIVLERFGDNPAIVAATQTYDETTNMQAYRVLVVDKQNGKIRYLKGLNQNEGIFYSINSDARTGDVKLYRQNASLTISADDGPKAGIKK
ncbi:MAG: hypothetical protein ACRCZF_10840, partial [Gemmataceae bacterium]